MTEGVCPNCGGLTSTPLYRCRCGTLTAAGEQVVCEDGICRPRSSMLSVADLTRDGLEQLNALLNESAP